MLNNIEAYQAVFNMAKLREKQHPENIYVQPQSKYKISNQLSLDSLVQTI